MADTNRIYALEFFSGAQRDHFIAFENMLDRCSITLFNPGTETAEVLLSSEEEIAYLKTIKPDIELDAEGSYHRAVIGRDDALRLAERGETPFFIFRPDDDSFMTDYLAVRFYSAARDAHPGYFENADRTSVASIHLRGICSDVYFKLLVLLTASMFENSNILGFMLDSQDMLVECEEYFLFSFEDRYSGSIPDAEIEDFMSFGYLRDWGGVIIRRDAFARIDFAEEINETIAQKIGYIFDWNNRGTPYTHFNYSSAYIARKKGENEIRINEIRSRW